MKEYQYILFDLDGTLTDPKEGITTCVAYALEYFGIMTEDKDELCKFIGPPLTQSFMEFYSMSEEDAKTAVEKYRERFGVKGLYENKVFDGIREILMSLKEKGKELIVATSKPTVYAKEILKYFDLYQYFSFVAGSNLDGTRVKKGEVIAYALEECQISDRRKVLMVGDREHDIIGAKENKIDVIGVLYGFGNREEFEKNQADYIVETVEKLKEIFMEEGQQ